LFGVAAPGIGGFLLFEGFEMQELKVHEVPIRQDRLGRYCLNDLHKAAGSVQHQRPQFWLENTQTKELVRILGVEQDSSVVIYRGGFLESQGTFACEEMAYAYAMWLSPVLFLDIIRKCCGLDGKAEALVPHHVLFETLQTAQGARRLNKSGHVYVLEFDSKAVKIGRSTNPIRRIKQLACQAGRWPHQQWVSPFLSDSYEVEKQAHDKLDAKRTVGEYFKVPFEEAVNAVESLCILPKGVGKLASLVA
jgi:hypothetical protein